VEGVIALGWATAEGTRDLAALSRMRAFVSLTSNEGALPSLAQIVIPVATHAETFGTFVNAKGVAQQFKRAVFPAEGVRAAWEVLAELGRALGRDLQLKSLSEVRAALPKVAPQEAQV
jgi:NADH-quinone oxidoreductase subunit G